MPKRIARAAARNPWTTLALAIVTGLAGFSIARALEEPPAPVWDPLGEYSIQTVTNRVPGIDGPAVIVGEPVHVTDVVKCNDWPEPVEVVGEFRWQSRTPAGLISPSTSGNATRTPGCEPGGTFTNIPPISVIQQMNTAILENNGDPVVWAITGEETPVNAPTGFAAGNGDTHTWTTENFTVVPRNYQPGEAP